MTIRPYESGDCACLAALFYDTVHTVNARDYTPEQLDAWAGEYVNLEAWDRSLLAHTSLVAEENGVVVGFGDLDETGYLDRLYIHRAYQRRGIATALCDALEASVGGTLTTHASITAKPFFEARGYQSVKEQRVERSGVPLTNYVMKKRRGGSLDA